jgi:DNA-binding MarR family transcriptional regulator
MPKTKRTPAGTALTALILDMFRLNSRMLAAGDRLVADLGLTSARWQLLGAIVEAERPQPVAWIARDLGANRQNVQRIVDDLHKEGLVAFEANPHHRRAQLVAITDKGRRTFESAMNLQAPWVNGLADGLSLKEIATVDRVLKAMKHNLEHSDERQKVAVL